jgi:hypothetical protein
MAGCRIGSERAGWFGAGLAVALFLTAPTAASGQDLTDLKGSAADIERQVETAPDGLVRFEFKTRPGVYGDGHTLNINSAGDPDWNCACTKGPGRFEARLAGGEISRVETFVGGEWDESNRQVTNLGRVSASGAADYMVHLARFLSGESAEEALTGAVVADSAVIWPELVTLARDRSRPGDVRSAAVFWLSQVAGEVASEELERFVTDDDEDSDIKSAAVFALSQLDEERGVPILLRLAREQRDPEVVQQVYFWLGQSEDPRAIALFEEILTAN